jgi:hypothetical protein
MGEGLAIVAFLLIVIALVHIRAMQSELTLLKEEVQKLKGDSEEPARVLQRGRPDNVNSWRPRACPVASQARVNKRYSFARSAERQYRRKSSPR